MKFVEATHCKSCGIIIKGSSIKQKRRAFCKYCYKKECQESWVFKKDIVNEERRLLRKKQQIEKTCICCGKKYKTAYLDQKTCGNMDCQNLMKKIQERIQRKEKRVFYTKNCKVYGSEFTTTLPRKLNCSKECISKYRENKNDYI